MLHVWLYELNPCGLFAGMLYPLPEWFEKMGISM